jgi:putative endonuclease
MTNDLLRRMNEHKGKNVPGFTANYNISRLEYYETTTDVRAVIAREKQIKGWLRSKKISLVEPMNPDWKDLSLGWQDGWDSALRMTWWQSARWIENFQKDWRESPVS